MLRARAAILFGSSPTEDVLLFILKPHRKTGTGDALKAGLSRVWWREQPFQAALG